MKEFSVIFEIVEEINCPLYEKGDNMVLTDKTFACPEGKEVCLILVRDMTQLLFQLLKEQGKPPAKGNAPIFSCSGCTGLIKFRRMAPKKGKAEKAGPDVVAQIDAVMREIHGQAIDSPFLRAVPADKLATTLEKFQKVAVKKGAVLVRQGEPNPNLYIILKGTCIVENHDIVMASLAAGEIFGEMSYLGTEVATTTVKATTDTSLLAINAGDFGELLNDSTSVQVFMARLLAERFNQINQAWAKDLEACMSGRIDEVAPAELFQVLHMHQKTGRLVMDLAQGQATVSFCEGNIVGAAYLSKRNQDAIFAVLAEKKGKYRFTAGLPAQEMKAPAIGDFMGMLMEGIKRVDEELHPG